MRNLASSLLIAWVLMPTQLHASHPGLAAQGVLDLRDCNFGRKCVHQLDGEWAFYWKRLLAPCDFSSDNPPQPDLFGKVPSYWSDYNDGEQSFSGLGYASYRLSILLPEGFRREIGFDVPVFDAAYNFYLDDELVWSNGVVGTSESDSRGGYQPECLRYTPESDTLHLLFQVSNFQHRRGGFWKSLRMGFPEEIEQSADLNRMVTFVSLGMLMSFSIFFLCFFILDRNDRIMLCFSILLAGILIRMMNTGIFPVQYFAEIPWNWMIRFEYLGSFLALGAALWYLYRLFPSRFHFWQTRINTVLTALCSVIILVTPVRIFAYTMYYMQPMLFILLVYYFFVCIRDVINGDKEKYFLLTGMLVLIAGFFHDILISHSRGGISHHYLLHFAIQLFIFLQAIMLIRRWIKVDRENRVLIREIAYINQNLEKLVDQRTKELEKRNREIEDRTMVIEARNLELNNALEFKNKVFSIIAHDLKSPVASLVQNSALLDLDLDQEKQSKVVKSFRELSSAALNLIDNLLYWGRAQGNQLKFRPTAIAVNTLLDQVTSLFTEMAKQKSITLVRDFNTDQEIMADQELLEIILRNVISNALKFTPENGRVLIRAEDPGSGDARLQIIIEDNGIGMDPETLSKLTSAQEVVSTAGTSNERGTGLGIKLCRELVQLNKGEMHIQSEKNRGTRVIIRLPMRSRGD